MKNAYLLQMRAKEEKMLRAREDEATETAVDCCSGRSHSNLPPQHGQG